MAATGPVALAKSSNKHNRAFVTASPLPEEAVRSMEANAANPRNNDKKVWAAGYSVQEQAECGVNQLVDETHGVDYLSESKVCTKG